MVEAASFADTLELGLSLFPDTETIYSISGSAETTKIHIHELEKASLEFLDMVSFAGLHELSLDEFREELKAIPDNSLILYLGWYRDTGRQCTFGA